MTKEEFIKRAVDTLTRCRSLLEQFQGEHALVDQTLVEINERLKEHEQHTIPH